jgi:predicted PurR-regulated permease PerM
MPLLVAAIVAILLDKPTKKLKQWGLPNWLSITLSIILMIVIFLLLTWLISSQINTMAGDWSTIKEKASEKLNGFSQWANQNLNWDYKDYIENNKRLVDKMESLASVFLSSIMNLLSQSLIIFVYIVLLLMQKKMFINFFKKLTSNPSAMTSLLSDSSKIISSYLFGKAKIMIFLFGIYYLGFTLGSVPYALFLAIFAALFSIIPYVGNMIGGGIAVILSYLYSGTTPALIVIGVISAAQLVENYILTPWIIGEEINLNPFITVFGIILFSVLWGLVGAIIALPIIGVLNVIFEHTKGMEAYAYLIKKKD